MKIRIDHQGFTAIAVDLQCSFPAIWKTHHLVVSRGLTSKKLVMSFIIPIEKSHREKFALLLHIITVLWDDTTF